MVYVRLDGKTVKSVKLAYIRSDPSKNEHIIFYDTDQEIQSSKNESDPTSKYDHIDIGIEDGLVKCLYKEQGDTTLLTKMFPIQKIDVIIVHSEIINQFPA